MNISLKNFIYAAVSAVISIALHLVVLGLADRIQIGGLPAFGETESRSKRLNIRSVDLEKRDAVAGQSGRTHASPEDLSRNLADQLRNEINLSELLKAERLGSDDKRRAQLTGLGRDLTLPDAQERVDDAPPPAPRPEILEIAPEDIPESHRTPDRHRIPKTKRRNLGDNLLSGLTADGDGPETGPGLGLGMRLSSPSTTPVLPEIPELGEATGEDEKPGSKYAVDPEFPETDDGTEDLQSADQQEPEAIDRMINASTTLYRPAGGTPGYFRIKLTPNPRSERLPAIPKDALFMIDCSNSIKPAKLRVFKDTVVDALDYLNPGDRFNVVSFRVRPHSLFESYTAVVPANIERAKDYVKGLYRQGLTDVYAALAPFVGTDKRSVDRPLTVFIFTDGQSTVDDKLDNETLLRRIKAANREQVSIYSASCGKAANRFLLDLLAYTNRGRPLHRRDLDEFKSGIVGFVRSHTDIIVSDVQYSATDTLKEEMYPKKLPLLYRGDTLSIFGRWPEGTDEIAVQLVGKSARDEPLDYVYRISLDDVERGGSAIQRDWVAQKAFFLIAEKTLSPDPELERRLQQLLKKFNMSTPYSEE